MGPYREFYVSYPKRRLVMALGFRDRVVQWAIYRQINPFIDRRYITHSYGCREGKGTLAAAQQLHRWIKAISRKEDAREWVILKCDVSKYFYRVAHEIALEIYMQYFYEDWLLWLMAEIINNPSTPFGLPEGVNISECPPDQRLYDVGMPIGNLTSQETANIYLNEVDQYAKHELRIRHYIRYMDDTILLIKGRKAAEETRAQLERFMRNRLKLAMNKQPVILPISHGCEFVGYRVTEHGLRLRKKTIQHIKRSLRRMERRYARGEIDQDDALATINSYMGMCKNINGYSVRTWIAENVVLRKEEPRSMIERHFTPYGIIRRTDGLIDILFPRGDCPVDCPCHDRITVKPRPDLEIDIRRDYDTWRARARAATDDRAKCVKALDTQLATKRAYESETTP